MRRLRDEYEKDGIVQEIRVRQLVHPSCATMDEYAIIGNGPNTVSESTVSDTELSEFYWAH